MGTDLNCWGIVFRYGSVLRAFTCSETEAGTIPVKSEMSTMTMMLMFLKTSGKSSLV